MSAFSSPPLLETELAVASLDILPNPVLIKDVDLNYVWVNKAFESLFNVKREKLLGKQDGEVFKERQAVQCSGGDMRVLASGEVDEAYETVFENGTTPRETITRKNRLTLSDGSHYLVGVMHDVTDVVNANRKLEASKQLLEMQSEELRLMANTDALTNCMNRRALFAFASEELAGSSKSSSVLLLDIDFFKKINDTYGHDAGDAALKHFVRTVKSELRENDQIARIGGEEFAVLLVGTTASNTQMIAERIRQKIETNPVLFHQTHIPMTVSIGATLQTDSAELNMNELLIQADKCLYQAKHEGRNRLVMTG